MDTMTIDVQTRDSKAKGRSLRRNNIIPAEYYGKGVKNHSIQMDYQTFRKILRKAGMNTLIELNVDGKEKLTVLVHDIQHDPVTDSINHVDFINVRMDQVVHAKIPLKFFGISPAVKELGGILTHTLTEVSVKCLPKDLIPFIEVSVEPVKDFHSYVRVKDLNVPATVTVLHDPGDVVVTAVAPKIEEEAPVVAPVAEGAAVGAEGAVAPGAEGVAAPGAEGAPAADAKKPEAKK